MGAFEIRRKGIISGTSVRVEFAQMAFLTIAHTRTHAHTHIDRSAVRGCHKSKHFQVQLLLYRSCHIILSLKGGVMIHINRIEVQSGRFSKQHNLVRFHGIIPTPLSKMERHP